MASKESIFDKLNLSSVERRLVMIVLVVLMSAFAWMVWRMIPDPGATWAKIEKAKNQLKGFTNEIYQAHQATNSYSSEIRELEGMGSEVVPIDQEVNMFRVIENLMMDNGVRESSNGKMTTETKEFFLERSVPIQFSSKESDIVKILSELGNDGSMMRVSEMRLKPDKNRYKLDVSMTVTASYQKNVKATQPKATETKPAASKPKSETKPAASKPKSETKPAASKPKSETKPAASKPKSETKPAASKTKPKTKPPKQSGTRRSVPARRVRTIDQ